MTIDGARVKRHLLAEHIRQAVREFELQTGLLVTDIELEKHSLCQVDGEVITTLSEVWIKAYL